MRHFKITLSLIAMVAVFLGSCSRTVEDPTDMQLDRAELAARLYQNEHFQRFQEIQNDNKARLSDLLKSLPELQYQTLIRAGEENLYWDDLAISDARQDRALAENLRHWYREGAAAHLQEAIKSLDGYQYQATDLEAVVTRQTNTSASPQLSVQNCPECEDDYDYFYFQAFMSIQGVFGGMTVDDLHTHATLRATMMTAPCYSFHGC